MEIRCASIRFIKVLHYPMLRCWQCLRGLRKYNFDTYISMWQSLLAPSVDTLRWFLFLSWNFLPYIRRSLIILIIIITTITLIIFSNVLRYTRKIFQNLHHCHHQTTLKYQKDLQMQESWSSLCLYDP